MSWVDNTVLVEAVISLELPYPTFGLWAEMSGRR
ncbi:hypothetical protein BJ970_007206 [Saccharopolyspora phatthalungensis]|uniref:Uncharacterized protein n=1 Tax=Saccharopolyspora phatthalungensis TaxID=664693 RepID=A0A840QHG1_9PSEU|nr:hypothetical protein [Saccharopolyspora phatthalungensis]